MKFETEWSIPVPWGNLRLRRCGTSDGERVLLIHGRQDSSTVFEPILEMMPEHYNYVALDMPGNGLSDPFPTAGILYYLDGIDNATILETAPVAQRPFIEYNNQRAMFYRPEGELGPPIARLHFLAAMELALDHLKWNTFNFMGHSMGCEQGLFYNAIHPGRISKMILLDALPTLMRMQITDPVEFQKTYYDQHYESFARANFYKDCYTHPYALRALRRMRDVAESEGERLLERNFHLGQPQQHSRAAVEENERRMARLVHLRETDPVGYLSWDNRLKHLAPTNYGNDYYFQLFKTVPPTLLVTASNGAKNVPVKWHKGAYELVDRLVDNVPNFRQVKVEGSHDVHFTHPRRVAPYVMKFLDENNNKVLCKL